ncbi:hypothetical protein DFH07DRAFT_476885 [Mycena maculata]|uniref:Uncharacterized protein n=1 Tax=Mycena maculata TaxID=230809 RepID=A0AAD7J4I5_9AGAR|nr:hypothetical protein DFH07DRAFT_476885 [Mycena maculata]
MAPWNKSDSKSSGSEADADALLKAFVGRAPTSEYTFDSERDAPQSELCRAPNNATSGGVKGDAPGRDCIILQMQSKRLFEAMQDMGFFCAMPMDPSRTHMECTPIPK